MTDAELLHRSSSGDEGAFQILYERHRDAVFSFAWVLTGTRDDAEDVTQECFLVLMRKGAEFDPARAQLRTWMMAVTRNLCHQHHRRKRPTEALDVDVQAVAPTTEEQMIQNEIAEAVRRAVVALPEPQREAVFLFEFEGLSLRDTASVLQIEPNAVKARLHRGREQLKRSLVFLKPETNAIGKDEL